MNTIPFPQFTKNIIDVVMKSDHPFIRQADEAVNYFLKLEEQLPDKYGWRISSVDDFTERIKNTNNLNPATLNNIYWYDTIRNLEAYIVTVVWRGSEILKPAIRSLNVGELITPAILSRALIELASSFLTVANQVDSVINQVIDTPDDAVSISHALEEIIARALWGSRLNEQHEYLKQKNCLTYIQKLSNHPDATELESRYNYLCELAHPNVIGNARFWSSKQRQNSDGSTTVEIQRRCISQLTDEILENILWSLSWATPCLTNGYLMINNGISRILKKWPVQ